MYRIFTIPAILVCMLVTSSRPASADDVFYGVKEHTEEFYRVYPDTGIWEFIGNTGAGGHTGLDYSPGILWEQGLWTLGYIPECPDAAAIRINAQTGQYIPDSYVCVDPCQLCWRESIAFHPTTGELYTVGAGSHKVYRIGLDGTLTPLAGNLPDNCGDTGQGSDFSLDGYLYMVLDGCNQLLKYDVALEQEVDRYPPEPLFVELNGMTIDSDGILWGLDHGPDGGGGTDNYLMNINPDTGAAYEHHASDLGGDLAAVPDCNGNEVSDFLDIDYDTSSDCNENGVPDECETRYFGVTGNDLYELGPSGDCSPMYVGNTSTDGAGADFSPDGILHRASGASLELEQIDHTDGSLISVTPFPENTEAIAFHPSGTLYFVRNYNQICTFDVDTGVDCLDYQIGYGEVQGMDFTFDGRLFALSSYYGSHDHNTLLEINLSTGEGIVVCEMDTSIPDLNSLDIDAMGVLHSVDPTSAGDIYLIDPLTCIVTSTCGPLSAGLYFGGLASVVDLYGGPDADGDAIQDGCDNCANDYNPGQEDCDGDGQGNACDLDDDNDGIDDAVDVCECNPGEVQYVDIYGRPRGDLDEDCDVDLNDFATFAMNYTGSR